MASRELGIGEKKNRKNSEMKVEREKKYDNNDKCRILLFLKMPLHRYPSFSSISMVPFVPRLFILDSIYFGIHTVAILYYKIPKE